MIPSQLAALSLYDVVQMTAAGYGDEEIIALIETTDARFMLEADDLVALKKAGVSERVIQVLLQRSETGEGARPPAEVGGPGPDVPGAESVERDHVHGETPHEATPDAAPAVAIGAGFSTFPYTEPGASHGGSHRHYAIAVAGVPVLILRDEADYPRVGDRAAEVVARLNALPVGERGRFVALAAARPVVAYLDEPSGRPVPILGVSAGDVVAYQRRSLGEVSAARLAAYWADSLTDYSLVFLLGRPPTQLVGLHLGRTLGRVYEQLTAEAAEADGAGDEPRSAPAVLDHLTAEEKEHLIELASRVPAEFSSPRGGNRP